MPDVATAVFNNEAGNFVLDLFLDRAAQVARAVCDRVGLPHKIIEQTVVPGKDDAFFFHELPHFGEHQAGDGAEIFFCELIEADDFIHTVNKLGAQEIVERLHGTLPRHIAEAAAENARLHPELFPEEKKSEPLIIRLNGDRPDPEDGPDGASSGGSRKGLSDRDTQMPRDAAADQEFSGPENEDEYKEWIRTVVKNKLAFSKQVIDNNYYETLFGKDEEADG